MDRRQCRTNENPTLYKMKFIARGLKTSRYIYATTENRNSKGKQTMRRRIAKSQGHAASSANKKKVGKKHLLEKIAGNDRDIPLDKLFAERHFECLIAAQSGCCKSGDSRWKKVDLVRGGAKGASRGKCDSERATR
jgi:hypothetical protein